jgi:3-hydroxyisobutyrate dehydrogenase-like beta-hydroxyacid dehydrogenase
MGQPMAGKLIDAGKSWRTRVRRSSSRNAVLPGTFDFGATIEILKKDVDLAIEQGEELGVPMWVCQAVRLPGPRKAGSLTHRPGRRGRHAQGLSTK